MQGNDDFFTSHKNKGIISPGRSLESTLISPERCQKLDLLIHLISNLRQALIICGPNGIGKTTLIDQLKLKKNDWPICSIIATPNLSFEIIQNQLSQFIKQRYPRYNNQILSSILSEQDKQNQKIVVIIDNAGFLVPGLIQTLIQYAASTLCLRIIFSLTHDEIQLKKSTDRSIDDCHFIEIPSLTKIQCGVFLKNLSAQPDAKFRLNECNDRLVEKIYRETHGVPGKIVSELPSLSDYSLWNNYKWVSIAFITIILGLGISFLIAKDSKVKSEAEEVKSQLLVQEAEEFEPSYTQAAPERKNLLNRAPIRQAIEKEILDIDKIPVEVKAGVSTKLFDEDINKLNRDREILLQQKSIERDVFQGAGREIKNLDRISAANSNKSSASADTDIKKQNKLLFEQTENTHNLKNSLIKQEIKKSKAIQSMDSGKVSIEKLVKNKSISLEKGIIQGRKVEKPNSDKNTAKTEKGSSSITQSGNNVNTRNDNSQWVIDQPEKYYTLQIMVLSKRQSVNEFIKKTPGLKDKLKFFQKNATNSKKYILIYGAFKNKAIATKTMNSLPDEYRKSWVRRFGILQKEIINN